MTRAVSGALAAVALATATALAQIPVTAGASVSLVEHRVTAGAGLERSSGTLFSVGARSTLPWRALEAQLSLRAGSLGAEERPATDRDVGEVALVIALPIRSWIVADGGLTIRRYESTIAAQRWVLGHLGVEARAPIIDEVFSVSAGVAMIPWASVSGISRPDLAVAATSGMAYTTGRLSATMRYRLERLDFPARDGVRRLEQLSSLELGVAWRMR